MNNILFIMNADLDVPRGTPLRICSILRQLQRKHEITIVAGRTPPEFDTVTIPYPSGGLLEQYRFVRDVMRSRDIDWVFTATEVGILVPILLKLTTGVRIAMDLHGLWHEELRAAGSIGWFVYWKLRYRSYVLLWFYDMVFPVVGTLKAYYAPFASHWRVVYGGVAVSDMIENMPEQGLVVGYTGNTRPYQGFPYLLDAAAILRSRGIPVRLNLIVSGEEGEVTKLLEERNLIEHAEIHSNVSHTEALKLVARSHALVIPRPSTAITEYAFPSKLPEYLLSGIPVIMTDVGPVKELREELASVAVIISPVDIAMNIAAALESIYQLPLERRRRMGQSARAFVIRFFDWEKQGAIIANSLARR